MAVSHQRKEELGQFEQRIAAARQETEELQNELDRVGSPEAVEEAVRPQGMTLEDEVLVILVGAPEEPLPEDEQEPATQAGFGTPREAWLDLFFGSR
jgi:hypothetical protein